MSELVALVGSLPGRVYEHFAQMAQDHPATGRDVDLCDALSRPRVKRRATGYPVCVSVDRITS